MGTLRAECAANLQTMTSIETILAAEGGIEAIEPTEPPLPYEADCYSGLRRDR
jgi:hypothetical protein